MLIGGSMESGSYLLAGIESGAESFFSTCHGSGRVMSRHCAKSSFNGRELQKQLEDRGIIILTSSYPGLAEEAGGAYKNIDDVIEATERGLEQGGRKIRSHRQHQGMTRMEYEILEGISRADIAFRVRGQSVEELFQKESISPWNNVAGYRHSQAFD